MIVISTKQFNSASNKLYSRVALQLIQRNYCQNFCSLNDFTVYQQKCYYCLYSFLFYHKHSLQVNSKLLTLVVLLLLCVIFYLFQVHLKVLLHYNFQDLCEISYFKPNLKEKKHLYGQILTFVTSLQSSSQKEPSNLLILLSYNDQIFKLSLQIHLSKVRLIYFRYHHYLPFSSALLILVIFF